MWDDLHNLSSGSCDAPRCLVVGAGMAGMTAAADLVKNGFSVRVVDKGRQPGGRMSTRRVDGSQIVVSDHNGTEARGPQEDLVFDHGVQYLSGDDPAFLNELNAWKQDGLLRTWSHGFGSIAHQKRGEQKAPCFAARNGMDRLARKLCQGLDIRLNTLLVRMERRGSGWWLQAMDGEEFTADAVIVTAPLPQALQLVGTAESLEAEALDERLRAVTYNPVFTVMALLDSRSRVPEPGAMSMDGNPIAWIADNRKKGVSPHLTTVTVHAGTTFSRTVLEDDPDAIRHHLLRAARAWFQEDPLYSQLHLWRYAQVREPFPEKVYAVHDAPPLLLAGDAFGSPSLQGWGVQRAWASGRAAAQQLSSLMSEKAAASR